MSRGGLRWLREHAAWWLLLESPPDPGYPLWSYPPAKPEETR